MDSTPATPTTTPTATSPATAAASPAVASSAPAGPLGPHAAEFRQLVDAARGLTPAQQAALEREYPSRGDDGTALAAAFDALTRAGRMTERDGDPVWDTLRDLDGVAGGAGSAAAGVLARDLVDDGVFRTLTCGWRTAGLGLPGDPVPAAPRTRWGWFELSRFELGARLLLGIAALIAAVVAGSRLPQDQQKYFLTAAVLLGVSVAVLGPVASRWHWED